MLNLSHLRVSNITNTNNTTNLIIQYLAAIILCLTGDWVIPFTAESAVSQGLAYLMVG
jgi:hypothetical protein